MDETADEERIYIFRSSFFAIFLWELFLPDDIAVVDDGRAEHPENILILKGNVILQKILRNITQINQGDPGITFQ